MAANATVREYMSDGSEPTYIGAIERARFILAACIADEALEGEPEHWQPWLDEYAALNRMRERALASFRQEFAAEQARRRAARAALGAEHDPAGCGCGIHVDAR